MTKESLNIEHVDTENKKQLFSLSEQAECSLDEYMYCISKVGKSVKAIQLFLDMNRDTIEAIVKREKEKN